MIGEIFDYNIFISYDNIFYFCFIDMCLLCNWGFWWGLEWFDENKGELCSYDYEKSYRMIIIIIGVINFY